MSGDSEGWRCREPVRLGCVYLLSKSCRHEHSHVPPPVGHSRATRGVPLSSTEEIRQLALCLLACMYMAPVRCPSRGMAWGHPLPLHLSEPLAWVRQTPWATL